MRHAVDGRTRRCARWMDTAHAQGSLFYLEACSFCMRGYAAMFRRASSLAKINLVLVSLYLMLHHEHYFAHLAYTLVLVLLARFWLLAGEA